MKKVVSIGTHLTNRAMEGDYQEVSLIQGEIREAIIELGNISILKMEFMYQLSSKVITDEEFKKLSETAEQKALGLELRLCHLKEKVNDLTGLMNLKWGSKFKGL